MTKRKLALNPVQGSSASAGYHHPRLTTIGPVERLTGGLGNYTSEENGYRIG